MAAVDFKLPVTNRAAFRGFVLGLLDHAEVMGPPEVRDEMVYWLVRSGGPGRAGRAQAAARPAAPLARASAPGQAEVARRRLVSRPSAAERLERLLAIVPWVVAQDGPTVAETCERFGISERDLIADLNLLFMCGVYPYTPDTLIEVDIDGGQGMGPLRRLVPPPLTADPAGGPGPGGGRSRPPGRAAAGRDAPDERGALWPAPCQAGDGPRRRWRGSAGRRAGGRLG